MDIALSLIIPAYNEAHRLPPYLQEIRDYLRRYYETAHEVIVVDDGSEDGTAPIVCEWGRDWNELRLLRHCANRGKGAALTTGILASQGGLILMVDADGATPIKYERRLREAVELGADFAIGSRLVAGAAVHRPWNRDLCSRLFAEVVGSVLRCAYGTRSAGSKCSAALLHKNSSTSADTRASSSTWSSWPWHNVWGIGSPKSRFPGVMCRDRRFGSSATGAR